MVDVHAWYKDQDGRVAGARYVRLWRIWAEIPNRGHRFDISEEWSKSGEAEPFDKVYPKWDTNYKELWFRFCSDYLNPDATLPPRKDARPSKAAPRPYSFETFDDQTPILPGQENGENIPHWRKKQIIRLFFLEHWCKSFIYTEKQFLKVLTSITALALGRHVAGIPWQTLSKYENRNYLLEPGSLPVGSALMETSRYTVGTLTPIWNHIRDLQKQHGRSNNRFRFEQVLDDGKVVDAKYDGKPLLPLPGRSKTPGVRGPPSRTQTEEPEGPAPIRGRKKRGKSKSKLPRESSSSSALEGTGKNMRAWKTHRASRKHAVDESEDDGLGPVQSWTPRDTSPAEESLEDLHQLSGLNLDDLRDASSDADGPAEAPDAVSEMVSNWTMKKKAPADVADTPNARRKFLRSLSGHRQYQDMLKAIDGAVSRPLSGSLAILTTLQFDHVTDGPISEHYTWLSWLYESPHLPLNIHSKEGWATFRDWCIKRFPKPGAAIPSIQRHALAIGLAIRDAEIVNEISPDPDDPIPYGAPGYFSESKIPFSDIETKLLHGCEAVVQNFKDYEFPGRRRALATPDPRSSPLGELPDGLSLSKSIVRQLAPVRNRREPTVSADVTGALSKMDDPARKTSGNRASEIGNPKMRPPGLHLPHRVLPSVVGETANANPGTQKKPSRASPDPAAVDASRTAAGSSVAPIGGRKPNRKHVRSEVAAPPPLASEMKSPPRRRQAVEKQSDEPIGEGSAIANRTRYRSERRAVWEDWRRK